MNRRAKSPTAVILNGVSPRAQAGAKRSEGSLTETRAEAVGLMTRVPSRRLRPFTVSDSSLRHCRKASKGSVQNDGRFLGRCAVLRPARIVTGGRGAFTFVEMLAAMTFLGILLPVLISALLVSSRAGSVAERSTTAMQLGENRLNELTLGDAWSSGESRGDFGTDWPAYRWELTKADWQTGAMTELVIHVFFPVQGGEHEVQMSTLVSDSLTQSQTTTQ